MIGSRGAGVFRRLTMRSVSIQVSRHARCPVVVIPAKAGDVWWPGAPRPRSG